MSRAAAGEMVERLVAKGLVRRDVSPADRRVVTVEVTAAAAPQVGAALERWRDRLQSSLRASPASSRPPSSPSSGRSPPN